MIFPPLEGKSHYQAPVTCTRLGIRPELLSSAFREAAGINSKLLPFAIGDVDPERGFVHVFDDVALEVVMRTCDTTPDFIDYLTKRERFLRSGVLQFAAGEEELLALYLQTWINGEHEFPSEAREPISIAEGEWDALTASEEWRSRRIASLDSYGWDKLIETFSQHILDGTAVSYPEHSFTFQETAVRALARENRRTRLPLALSLADFLLRPYRDDLAARIISPPRPGSPYFIFLTLVRKEGVDHDQYREIRRAYMHGYATTLKLQYPDAQEVVVIATEPNWSNDLCSQDILYCDVSKLTKEDEEMARASQLKTGLLTKLKAPWGSTEIDESRFNASINRRPKRKSSLRNSLCACGSGKKYKKCCQVS